MRQRNQARTVLNRGLCRIVHLDEKLGEELQKYLEGDSIDELADMVEVIYAILKYKGVDLNYFEGIRQKKAADRGAFDKRLLLREVID